MMTEPKIDELAGLIRGLNGYLSEVAQEVADLRVDLQTVASHLAIIAAVLGGHQ